MGWNKSSDQTVLLCRENQSGEYDRKTTVKDAAGSAIRLARFERALLPHLDAAHNLARWLTGSSEDARDVVQDACVRALTFFDGFHGEDGRGWLLKLVRNTCYDWLRKNRRQAE